MPLLATALDKLPLKQLPGGSGGRLLAATMLDGVAGGPPRLFLWSIANASFEG